ncbi:11321_t:CDS:2 [Funneliformis mosseae]|uniref:11321_t:CDS:1 n=1 Tax=Funneliformis mosseae TaxID=27381 RepID=A0A9N8WA86_FUNMO|nr:11321_t:CDS:2 [Funneliformis mosseae]
MFTLYVWGSGFDLASIDPGCLTAISYFQLFVSEEWCIIECNNPNLSWTGELPVLKDGVEWVTGINNIIKYMKRKRFDADEHLTSRQRADSLAQIAKARLEKYGIVSVGDREFLVDTDKQLEMYKIIRKSYEVLLNKIGNEEFFLGNKVSTLDITIYGHLAVHLYSDLPNPNLAIILNTEYPSLARFCERMKNRLSEREIVKLPANDLPSVFTGIFSSPRTWFNNTFWRTRNVEKRPEKSQAQKDFERKRLMFITGAVLFMVIHVVWNGIIRIEFTDVDSEEEEHVEETEEYDEYDDDDDEKE